MDDREVGRYWESNAEAWTKLSRAGWDVYRDHVNTPAFLEMLPGIAGLRGLDLGCGEGSNTRLLAGRGARMFAVDVAPTFVRHAASAQTDIDYAVGSGLDLPFAAGVFDFVAAFMSLMDMPRVDRVFQEARRVLKPGGFCQFSILHPCTNTPYRKLLRDERGEAYAIEVGRYFDRLDGDIDRFLFSAAPAHAKAGLRPFEVPRFHRTLADWINAVLDAGFVLERVSEPMASEEVAARVPAVADTRVAPYFLHLRIRR